MKTNSNRIWIYHREATDEELVRYEHFKKYLEIIDSLDFSNLIVPSERVWHLWFILSTLPLSEQEDEVLVSLFKQLCEEKFDVELFFKTVYDEFTDFQIEKMLQVLLILKRDDDSEDV